MGPVLEVDKVGQNGRGQTADGLVKLSEEAALEVGTAGDSNPAVQELKAEIAQAHATSDGKKSGTVLYFGYGSNMSNEGMLSKGLTPLHNYRAVLKDYKLVFNMSTPLLSDPAFANIESCPGSEVHGNVIEFEKDEFDRLAAMEFTYDVIQVQVEEYEEDGGNIVTAGTFCANEERVMQLVNRPLEHKDPSWRYRGMLVAGAEQCRLRPQYVAQLRAIPVATPPQITHWMSEEVKGVIASREFTEQDITDTEIDGLKLTCLKGVVAKVHAKFVRLWAGRDVTLMTAQRVMVCSDTDNLTEK